MKIATAFIHLLSPAIEELGSSCLADKWGDYVCVYLMFTDICIIDASFTAVCTCPVHAQHVLHLYRGAHCPSMGYS